MKKLFLSLFAVLLCAVSATAQQFSSDGLSYNITDATARTVEVRGASNSATTALIPETVEYDNQTYTVTSIREQAFHNCVNLTEVSIPVSVTSMGRAIFAGCNALVKVVVAEGNTVYDSRNDCNAVIETSTDRLVQGCKATIIPNGVLTIGERSFHYCYELKAISFPSSVRRIESGAFYFCSALSEVTFSDGLTTIGDHAFTYCRSLTEVTLPQWVTSIGNWTFDKCSSLTKVVLSASLQSIGNNAFAYCTSLTAITLPANVESIGDEAFRNCGGLTAITIPASVKRIGVGVFSDCSGLTEIVVEYGNYPYSSPDNCNAIIEYSSNEEGMTYTLIAGCQNTIIPENVTHIGRSAFYGCTGLKEITLPNTLTTIEAGAFSGCSSLTEIALPNTLTTIEAGAFSGCSGLTEITIPAEVTTIGIYAFSGCNSLQSVIWNARACEDVIGNEDGSGDIVDMFGSLSSIRRFSFGEHVTRIPAYLCYGMSGLTEIIIPEGIRRIGDRAFDGCSGLRSVTWNAIRCEDFEFNSPFGDHSSLTSFTFGEQVTYIPMYVCKGMSGLRELTIPASVMTIRDWAFQGCGGLQKIVVAEGNTRFDSREDCNALIGTSSNTLIAGCQNTIIPNSVKRIGSSAFEDCSGLTEITIPEGVTSIGGSAFLGCSGLTEITIPDGVTSIGSRAFQGCSGLTTIVVAAGNTQYDSRNDCNAIIETATNTLITGCQKTIIPDGVTSIGSSAFYSCTGLTEITLPASVTSIAELAFYDCSGLKTVTSLAQNPPMLGRSAFHGIAEEAVLYVYNTVLENYKASDWQPYFADILPIGDVPSDLEDVYGNGNETGADQGNTGVPRKVIRDGKVLILRGGQVYDFTGARIE